MTACEAARSGLWRNGDSDADPRALRDRHTDFHTFPPPERDAQPHSNTTGYEHLFSRAQRDPDDTAHADDGGHSFSHLDATRDGHHDLARLDANARPHFNSIGDRRTSLHHGRHDSLRLRAHRDTRFRPAPRDTRRAACPFARHGRARPLPPV